MCFGDTAADATIERNANARAGFRLPPDGFTFYNTYVFLFLTSYFDISGRRLEDTLSNNRWGVGIPCPYVVDATAVLVSIRSSNIVILFIYFCYYYY